MELYEVPEIPQLDESGADTSLQQLGELNKEMASDPSHPLNVPAHRLHEQFVQYRTRLYERAYGGAEEDEAAQGAEAQAEKQNDDLIEQAQEEMDALEELGFSRDEIPDDVQPYQVTALKMQRLNAERNFTELTPLLERELTALGAKGMDTFRSFARDGGLTADERAEHIELILKRIYQANKERKNGF
jgi:hypothetical protein